MGFRPRVQGSEVRKGDGHDFVIRGVLDCCVVALIAPSSRVHDACPVFMRWQSFRFECSYLSGLDVRSIYLPTDLPAYVYRSIDLIYL